MTHGEHVTINVEPKGLPVGAYFRAQGRFRDLRDAALEQVQAEVDKRWDRLAHDAGRPD